MRKIHPIVAKLLEDIDAYCKMANIGKSTFGIEAVNNSALVSLLESGREPRLSTIERCYAFMDRKTKAVTRKAYVEVARR